MSHDADGPLNYIIELMKLGDHRRAVENLRTLISSNERELRDFSEKLRGSDLRTTGIALLETIKQFLDTNSLLHQMIGDCAVQIPDHSLAVQSYRQAIMNKPDLTYFIRDRGGFKPIRVAHPPIFRKGELGGRKLVDFIEFSSESIANELGVPMTDQESYQGLVLGGQVANDVRYRNDIAHFAVCYLRLGKAYYIGPKIYLSAKLAFEAALEFLGKVDRKQLTGPSMNDYSIVERSLGPCQFDLGMCNFYLSNYSDSLANYQSAMRVYSGEDHGAKPPNYLLGLADCLLYMGICHMKTGKSKEAMEELQQCVTLSSELHVLDNINRAEELIRQLKSQNVGDVSNR
jgi:tetratricopeptide (TPR) repeat protein